jgi:hypothetical protein
MNVKVFAPILTVGLSLATGLAVGDALACVDYDERDVVCGTPCETYSETLTWYQAGGSSFDWPTWENVDACSDCNSQGTFQVAYYQGPCRSNSSDDEYQYPNED